MGTINGEGGCTIGAAICKDKGGIRNWLVFGDFRKYNRVCVEKMQKFVSRHVCRNGALKVGKKE